MAAAAAASEFNLDDDPASAAGSSDCELPPLQAVPVSSREQMMEHGPRFVSFVHSKNATADLKVMDERAVNEYLRFFYFTLETKSGSRYSPSSLICIRAGIQRYLELVLGRKLVLPGNPIFMTSNRMLNQRAKEYVESGGNIKHYEPIGAADMQLLTDYFNGTSIGPYPMQERLQDEVLFSLLYHFGSGQQQNLRPVARDSLVFSVDEEGREFASLTLSTPGASAVRMYDLGKLRFYISQLPATTKDNSLFPKPLRGGEGFSVNSCRGVNYLQNFMRTLSKKASLGQLYSNHSIRLTRILDLDRSGCSAQQIRSVTGHRCEKSVKRCLRWGSGGRRRTRAASSSGGDAAVAHDNGADGDWNSGDAGDVADAAASVE